MDLILNGIREQQQARRLPSGMGMWGEKHSRPFKMKHMIRTISQAVLIFICFYVEREIGSNAFGAVWLARIYFSSCRSDLLSWKQWLREKGGGQRYSLGVMSDTCRMVLDLTVRRKRPRPATLLLLLEPSKQQVDHYQTQPCPALQPFSYGPITLSNLKQRATAL